MCWTVREYYPNWWTLLLVCLSTQRWHSKWLLPEQGIASVLQKIIQCQQILINTKWPISNQILSLLTILPLYKSHTQCEILFVNRWLSEDNRGKSDISYQVVYVFYIVDKIENFEFDNGIETGFLSQKLDREFWFKNIDSDPTAQCVNTHVNTYACHLKCHNKCK